MNYKLYRELSRACQLIAYAAIMFVLLSIKVQARCPYDTSHISVMSVSDSELDSRGYSFIHSFIHSFFFFFFFFVSC